MAVAGGELHVADTGAKRIVVFDRASGALLRATAVPRFPVSVTACGLVGGRRGQLLALPGRVAPPPASLAGPLPPAMQVTRPREATAHDVTPKSSAEPRKPGVPTAGRVNEAATSTGGGGGVRGLSTAALARALEARGVHAAVVAFVRECALDGDDVYDDAILAALVDGVEGVKPAVLRVQVAKIKALRLS